MCTTHAFYPYPIKAKWRSFQEYLEILPYVNDRKKFEDTFFVFSQRIWHTPDEMPNRNINSVGAGEKCLLKIKNTNEYIVSEAMYDEEKDVYYFESIAYTYTMDDVEIYAYINDLLLWK